MKYVLTLVALCVAGCAGSAPRSAATSAGDTVGELVAAYADRDLDRMARLFHPDIEWMAVDGANVERVARGRDELRALMAENIAQNPDARWHLVSNRTMGPYVAATEVAEWNDGDSRMENVVVYEVQDGMVRRVWFYPPANGQE